MALRRLEYNSRRTHLFWEIEVEGNACKVWYGKVGSDGQIRTTTFATPEQAAANADQQVRAKIRKGYKPIKTVVLSEAQAKLLVHADELQAAGDPWGQRIALWFARETGRGKPGYRKLLDELDALERTQYEYFHGPELAALQRVEGFSEVACFSSEYGYCVHARIGTRKSSADGPKADDVLRALVASPVGKRLRELTVDRNHREAGELAGVSADIVSGGELAELECLTIGELKSKEPESSGVMIGDLSPLWTMTPKLHTLLICGSGIELGELVHPSLTRLEIETSGLSREAMVSLAHAKLPELTAMTIQFGHHGHSDGTAFDALRPLFSSETLPKLRHLGLHSTAIQDEIALELIGSPLLAQLERVDLSMAPLHPPSFEAILANAASFRHLELLKLDRYFIDDGQRQHLRLHEAFGKIVRVTREWRPDE